MAKKSMMLRTNALRSSLRKLTLVANVVDVHTQFIANLNFAVFASVNWLTKVKFQVLPKLLGKKHGTFKLVSPNLNVFNTI